MTSSKRSNLLKAHPVIIGGEWKREEKKICFFHPLLTCMLVSVSSVRCASVIFALKRATCEHLTR